MRLCSLFLLLTVLNSQLSSARAATTATMSVTAQIVGGCTINGVAPPSGGSVGSFGALDFGAVSSLSLNAVKARLDTGSAITLNCTPGITVMMTLDDGLHPFNGSRTMMRNGGTERIAYSLYGDSSYSTALVSGASFALDTSHSPASLSFPVYGRATPDGTSPPGQYSDTVTVTIQW